MDLIATAHGALLVVTVCQDRIDAACAIQFKERIRKVTQPPWGVVWIWQVQAVWTVPAWGPLWA